MKVRPHSEEVRSDLVVRKTSIKRNGTHFTVVPEVKSWLQDMVKSHWYLYEHKEYGGLRIAFHDHNDAMKFKLAWH